MSRRQLQGWALMLGFLFAANVAFSAGSAVWTAVFAMWAGIVYRATEEEARGTDR